MDVLAWIDDPYPAEVEDAPEAEQIAHELAADAEDAAERAREAGWDA